jgi:hypothetical protein
MTARPCSAQGWRVTSSVISCSRDPHQGRHASPSAVPRPTSLFVSVLPEPLVRTIKGVPQPLAATVSVSLDGPRTLLHRFCPCDDFLRSRSPSHVVGNDK